MKKNILVLAIVLFVSIFFCQSVSAGTEVTCTYHYIDNFKQSGEPNDGVILSSDQKIRFNDDGSIYRVSDCNKNGNWDCAYADEMFDITFFIHEGFNPTITNVLYKYRDCTNVDVDECTASWIDMYTPITYFEDGYYINQSSENFTCPNKLTIGNNYITDDYYIVYSGDYGDNPTPRYSHQLIKTEKEELVGPCYTFKDSDSCDGSKDYACVWNKNENAAGDQGGYCNVDNLLFVGCGGASDIPMQVPALISFAVNILKIATPIILIFISMVTLLKALAAGKDDEIKKAQSSLIKKIIAAALVFFVVAIVQFIVSKVADDDEYQGFSNCLDCFLNNKCDVNTYYKTVVGGEDICTRLTEGSTVACKTLFSQSDFNMSE